MDTNNTTNDTRKRFEDARARYAASQKNEVLTGDRDSDDANYNNILDLLQKQANRNPNVPLPVPRPVAVGPAYHNDNNLNIPIPLPVKAIDEEILARNQSKTNQLLDQLQDTIVTTALPQPIQIDDSAIAHETTLQHVAELLNDILNNLRDFAKEIVDNFLHVGRQWTGKMDELVQSEVTSQGWLTRAITTVVDKIRGVDPRMETTVDKIAAFLAAGTAYGKKQVDYLKGLYELQVRARKTNAQEARKLVNDEDKGPLAGFMDLILPSNSIIRKAFDGIGKIGDFIKNLGEAAAEKAGPGVFGLLMSSPAAISGIVTSVLGLFGGLAGFLTSVIGAAAFASVYAMFKHPEQLVDLLGAFGDLFSKVVIPAFEWIAKEIIPPLTVAFAGLMVAADYLLDNVGTFINKELTKFIGTDLPELLTFIGSIIDTLYKGVKTWVLSMAGMFGVGPNGDKGFLKNFFTMIFAIPDAMLEVISKFATQLITELGLSDFFGLKEGEGLYGRIKRFFMEDIPKFAIDTFNSMIDLIHKLNPITLIEQKIRDFTEAIVNLIPTWQDIKKWVADSIPEWVSDNIRDWILQKLDVENSEEVSQNALPQQIPVDVSQNALPQQIPADEIYNAPVSSFARQAATPPIIYAPSTVNNTDNSSVTTQVGGRGRIGTTSPERYPLDDMLYRATP